MCGSGGSSGVQKFEWNEALAPFWGEALENANALKDRPYERYQWDRIAGFDDDQNTAKEGIRHFVGSGGSPVTIAANGQIQNTLDDDYLSGTKMNPGALTSNAYEGINSPIFQNLLNRGQQDIIDKYQQGTSADTTRTFNMSGAFGGSAHQKAVANNEAGLAKGLGDYTAGMQNDQYNRSAGLRENLINRGMQAYEGERGRQMGAIGMGQNEQALAFDRFQKLMGVGDMERSLKQDFLNLDFQDWQDAKNNPFKMSDFFTGVLSRAQGGMAPNSTTTMPGYGASPYSQLLGAGLLGKSFGLY